MSQPSRTSRADSDSPMRAAAPGPIESAAAWRGRDIEHGDDWIYRLSDQEIEAAESVARQARDLGRGAGELTSSDFDLGALAPAVTRWREALHRGLGFVLVRGLPVDRLREEDAAAVYWAIGLGLGMPVAQNMSGDLLTDIRDDGADPDDPSTRLYRTRREQDFHTDGADIIGLLCLKTSKSGGLSRIVSSTQVYNEVLARRPDLAPVLFGDFYWHYFDPAMDAPMHFVRPICTETGGGLNVSFIAWYIRQAEGLPGVPPMSAEQEEAVACIESIANEKGLYLDMDFAPGDIQLLKNSVILHKRTEYEDWEEPERKRHLLRLWLAAADFEDGDEQLRGGIRTDAAG